MKPIPALAVLTLAMLAGCAEQRPVEAGNPLYPQAPGQSVTGTCAYPAGVPATNAGDEAGCVKAGGKWTLTTRTGQ